MSHHRFTPAAILFSAILGGLVAANAGCSAGPDDEDDGSGAAVTSDQDRARAERAADLAKKIASGDPATLKRVEDVQKVPSRDRAIGAWSAYTLVQGDKAASRDPKAKLPTEMVFLGGPNVVYVDVGEGGGQALLVAKDADADALRKTLASDLRGAPKTEAASSPKSLRPLGAAELATKGVMSLVERAAAFLEQESADLVAEGFTRTKVAVRVTGETSEGAVVHLEETLATHEEGALRVHARAPRTTDVAGVGALTDYELAVLETYKPTGGVLLGRDGITKLAGERDVRALVLGNWNAGELVLAKDVDQVVFLAGSAWPNGSVFRNGAASRYARDGGGPLRWTRIFTTEAALEAGARAQTAAAAGRGAVLVEGRSAAALVVGHTEGATYNAGLEVASHVYCAAPTEAQREMLLTALTAGKTVHVGSDAERTKFVAFLLDLLKKAGSSCVSNICEYNALAARVVVK